MDNSAISNKTQVSDHISECVGIMSSLEMGQHSVVFQPDAKLMFSEASERLLVMKAGRPLLVWFQEVMTLLHYYLLLNPCGAADHDHRRRPTWHMSDIVLSEAPKDHCRFYKVGYMVFCDIEREYRRRFLAGTLLGLNQRGFKNENEVHQQILRECYTWPHVLQHSPLLSETFQFKTTSVRNRLLAPDLCSELRSGCSSHRSGTRSKPR